MATLERMVVRRVDPWATAVVLSFVGVTVAWLGTEWALRSADGVVLVVHDDGSTFDTEVITGWLYGASAVAGVALVALAARFRWQPGAIGLAGVVAALVWGGAVSVDRYRDSGASEGLGVLVFLVPLLAVGVGVGVIAQCAVASGVIAGPDEID